MLDSNENLLSGIQQALLDSETGVAPILLKVRYLAKRLGSGILEQWVTHEGEGYPDGVEVPDYRVTPLAFTGDFSGPFGSGVRNAPIPSVLIRKFAGEEFTSFKIRGSIAEVDDLLSRSRVAGETTVRIPGAQNLLVLLTGKVYPDMECNSVVAEAPISAFAKLQSVVRNRLLDLTFELESQTNAGEITVSSSPRTQPPDQPTIVNHIAKQVIHGDSFTTVATASDSAQVEVKINAKDRTSLVAALQDLGLDPQPAEQLAQAISSEEVTHAEPIGPRTRKWLEANVPSIVGKLTANLLIPLILQFHGLT